MDVEELFQKIPHYDGIHKLPQKGGTITRARFVKPKLQEFGGKLPAAGAPLVLKAITKHSDRDDMIHCGLSASLYFRLMQNVLDRKPPDPRYLQGHRFQVLLEQQCIVALASVFETFVKSIIGDAKGFKHVPHNFEGIDDFLKKKDIKIRELGDLGKRNNYRRIKNIVDYLFLVRNLIVHNGGIVDKPFQKHYGGRLKKKMIGKLIRIDYKDISAMRSWVSYLVQEICKRVPSYDKVWLDYVQSVGIVLPGEMSVQPVYLNGSVGPLFRLEEGE